jgi:hypothetical protein
MVLGIVSIVYLLFITARLSAHGYDTSYFVTAGDQFCDPNLVPKTLTVTTGSNGYDGQVFYRLALNPFTSTPTEFGVTFDSPQYRQQRIVYPFLVWVLSIGDPDRVPMMLIRKIWVEDWSFLRALSEFYVLGVLDGSVVLLVF